MLWAHAHTRNPGSNPAEQIGPRVVPRGVAIPDVPQQLFDAAERLLLRDGPGGLTSRAITDEAGCAKGILHNHFADLDGFLAAFVVDRSRRIAEHAKQLASSAGQRTVVTNLTDALVTLFGPGALAISRLMTSRTSLLARVQQAQSTHQPVLHEVEAALAAYLDTEKKRGRIPAGADTQMLAFTLLASAHHLFFTEGGQALDRRRVRRIVTTLVAGLAPPTSAPDTDGR
jgi:AcrR family transcriptional regulator